MQNSPPVFNLSDSEPEDFYINNSTQYPFENKKRTRRKKSENSPSKKAKIENVHECSICLSKIKAKRMGNPSGCKHNFCVDCIKKWAKVRMLHYLFILNAVFIFLIISAIENDLSGLTYMLH